jgi:hypothetical protein
VQLRIFPTEHTRHWGRRRRWRNSGSSHRCRSMRIVIQVRWGRRWRRVEIVVLHLLRLLWRRRRRGPSVSTARDRRGWQRHQARLSHECCGIAAATAGGTVARKHRSRRRRRGSGAVDRAPGGAGAGSTASTMRRTASDRARRIGARRLARYGLRTARGSSSRDRGRAALGRRSGRSLFSCVRI